MSRKLYVFVAVFLGCTSTGRVGLCFSWFYVQELPKAQPAVVLVLKRLRRRGNGLKSHPTDWEKPGIEPATPGSQDIGLSPTPRRLLVSKTITAMSYKLGQVIVGWFCCFTSQVNSYGHCGTVSSPNHTFSWAGLNKRLTSNL